MRALKNQGQCGKSPVNHPHTTPRPAGPLTLNVPLLQIQKTAKSCRESQFLATPYKAPKKGSKMPLQLTL